MKGFTQGRMALAASGLMILCGTLPAAQEIVGGRWELLGTRSDQDFPRVFFAYPTGLGFVVGDLDGDSWPELLVGTEGHFLGSFEPGGGACFSSRTGEMLFDFRPERSLSDGMGFGFAPGVDYDSDGVVDFLTFGGSTTRVSSVWEVSGRDGHTILTIRGPRDPVGRHYGYGDQGFGVSAMGIPDQDGDGMDDILVGAAAAPLKSGQFPDAGAVFCHSSRNGSPLWRIDNPYPSLGLPLSHSFGLRLFPIQDLDGDGLRDFVVASYADDGSHNDAGVLMAFSSATRTMLREVWLDRYTLFANFFDIAVSDLDGDGWDDAVFSGTDRRPIDKFPNALAVSIARNGLLWEHKNPPLVSFMDHGVGGDYNLDGRPDILETGQAAYPSQDGFVQVLDAVTGTPLLRLEDPRFSPVMSVIGFDPPGTQGEGRIFATATAGGISGLVGLRYERGIQADEHVVHAGTGGTVTVDLDFGPREGGDGYRILASLAGRGPSVLGSLEVPLGNDPLFQRSQTQALPWMSASSGRLDGQGRAQVIFAPPAGAMTPLVGRILWAAAVSYDASGFLSSTTAIPLKVLP